MTAETTRAAADAELDSAVVAAHRDLAGLAVLLDDEALAEFIGAPGARGDRLRLKPASSARLSVVDAAGRWSIVHAFAPAAWAKAVKDIANVGPAGRSSVVIDERRRLVATPATDDRRLVSLDAWRPDSQKWPRRAAFEGLRPLGIRGSRSGRRALRVRTLAHNPSRRWVGVVLSAGEPVAVVKVFARSTDARRAPSMAAAIGAGGVVPRHATAPALRNTHVMSWVDGRHADPAGDAGIVAATLNALASVDPSTVPPADPAGLTADLRRAWTGAARTLGALAPEWGRRAGDVAGRLLDDDRPAASCVVAHGDLSPDQVLIAGPVAMLLDLDRAGRAPAGWDGASWIAAQVAGGAAGPSAALPGQAPDDWTRAAASLLRAPEPFRRRRPGRVAATEALLGAAEVAAGLR